MFNSAMKSMIKAYSDLQGYAGREKSFQKKKGAPSFQSWKASLYSVGPVKTSKKLWLTHSNWPVFAAIKKVVFWGVGGGRAQGCMYL